MRLSPTLIMALGLAAAAAAASGQAAPPASTEANPAATCPCPPPPPPPPIWQVSLGAGLSKSSGNTDSESYSLAFDAVRDAGGRQRLHFDALYLRGSAGDVTNVDKATVGARDDYRLTERLAAFGDLRYVRDPFKQIDSSWAPTVGLAWRVAASERVSWAVDAGVGYILESYSSGEDANSGTLRLGEALGWQLSPTARLTHVATATWKTRDTEDALYHLELGIAAGLTAHSELKVAVVDDYRNLPAAPGLDKNDVSTVVTVGFKL
jgi:putative salt-induced outer membrane protein YdiY